MKKHNANSFIKLIFTLCLTLLFITGCQTVPVSNPVNPLDLLDKESSFYIAVPSKADPELITKLIENNIEGMSETDAENLASRIQVVYCGMNRTRNSTEIQSAIKANVPSALVPKMLSTKNGWSRKTVSIKNSEDYSVYEREGMNISFPGNQIVCLGRGQEYMLNLYSEISNDSEPKESYSELPPQMFNYLNDAESEIRFYANKPQSFLTILTGANLDLRLVDVCGKFTCDPKHENQYNLELDFRFRSDKYLKAGKGLLSLAFGLANGQAEVVNDSELIIKDIKLKKEQLYRILVLAK